MSSPILSKNTQPESDDKDLKSMAAQESECPPVRKVSGLKFGSSRFRVIRGANGLVRVDVEAARAAMRHAMKIRAENRKKG